MATMTDHRVVTVATEVHHPVHHLPHAATTTAAAVPLQTDHLPHANPPGAKTVNEKEDLLPQLTATITYHRDPTSSTAARRHPTALPLARQTRPEIAARHLAATHTSPPTPPPRNPTTTGPHRHATMIVAVVENLRLIEREIL